LNLAVVFGVNVIWPHGINGGTNWFAAGLSVAAFIVLHKTRVDVLWVVLTGGVIGLSRTVVPI
jgi:chromate transporter